MKLLGLDTLVTELSELKKSQSEMVITVYNLSVNMDEYVREDDVNDRIDSYLIDNDYATQSYVDEEVESKVSDAIENEDIQSKVDEAIEGLELDSKPASTEELKAIVNKEVKSFMLNSVRVDLIVN
jgi:hypothetical protein